MKSFKLLGSPLVLITAFFLCSFSISTSASIVVLNGLTHIHKVNKGQVVSGIIELQNAGFETRAIQVYQRDYSFKHTGEVFYDQAGTNDRSNAKWLDYSPTYLELAPQQKTVVKYEMTIPEGEDLIGSYWSVLMVEGITPIDPSLPQPGVNISAIMRYAIQIVAEIGEEGKSNLEFVDAKLDKINGAKVSSIALENTGERLLIPVVSIELFDENGTSVKVVKTNKKKIYPGTSAKFLLELDDLPMGQYEAVVLADCEAENVFGLNLSLSLSND